MTPLGRAEAGRFGRYFPVQPGYRTIVLRNGSVAPERGLSNRLHHANRA